MADIGHDISHFSYWSSAVCFYGLGLSWSLEQYVVVSVDAGLNWTEFWKSRSFSSD